MGADDATARSPIVIENWACRRICIATRGLTSMSASSDAQVRIEGAAEAVTPVLDPAPERRINDFVNDRRSIKRARHEPRTEYLAVTAPDEEPIGFARLGLSGVKAAKLGYAGGRTNRGCG